MWGLGFRLQSLGFGVTYCRHATADLGEEVYGFGFRVSGFGFRVSGFGFRVLGLGFRVSGLGFRVSGLGFRVTYCRHATADLGEEV